MARCQFQPRRVPGENEKSARAYDLFSGGKGFFVAREGRELLPEAAGPWKRAEAVNDRSRR
jgi:hypothetical protein